MNNNDFYIRNNSLQTDNSNKGKKKIVPVLILVLLVGVAGFLVYELKFKKDNTKKSDEYVEYDPNYKLEDGESKQELDSNGSDGLIDVEGNPTNDSNSNVTSSNKAPDNILSNILSNVNKTSNNSSSSNTNKNIRVTGVSINNQNITMYVGQTSSVSSTVTPENATNKSVTWKSSNTDIVTIDNSGKLVAKKVGTANITVTTNDGGKSSTTNVTVVAQSIPVTGVKFTKTNLSIEKNANSNLTTYLSISPSNATNKEVTWSSSNTSVAVVDQNGKVTGKNYGSAIITATTKDGGKSAKLTVSVPQPQVKSIYIKTYNYIYIGDFYTFYPVISPSNAVNKELTWTSSNPSVATVNKNGRVDALAEGQTTITVKSSNGVTASSTIDCKFHHSSFNVTIYKNESKDPKTGRIISYTYVPIINILSNEKLMNIDHSKILYNGITIPSSGYSSQDANFCSGSSTATLYSKKGTPIVGVRVSCK